MTRNRLIVLLVLLAGLVGGICFVVQQHQSNSAIEARRRQLRERRTRLAAELELAMRTVGRSTGIAAPEARPTAEEGKPALAARSPRPPSLMEIGRDNPHFMNAWVADQRARLQQRYGVLFQKLGLGPGERERFKDIVAAQAARSLDISAAAVEKGLAWEDPVIRKLQGDSEREMDRELRELLGDDGFTAYQRFNESVRLRGFVDGFAVQVAETEPLTPGQAEQLAQALVAAAAPPMPDKARDMDPKSVDWPRMDQAAQRILTPAQFAAWKLGVAHNPFGGSRIDQEVTKIYEAAKAKDVGAP